jgi:hypothetical protein
VSASTAGKGKSFSLSIGKGRKLQGGKGGSVTIVKSAPMVAVQKSVVVEKTVAAPIVQKSVSASTAGKGKSFSLSIGKGL